MNMWYKFWRPDLIPKNGTEISENLTALNRMISCQSIEPLTKIDYKCKLCKFETLEISSLKSHLVAIHKFDETKTDWNKCISLCKRVIIENPELGSEPGPKDKLKTSSLTNSRFKKRKHEPEEHSMQDQNKERPESHLTLSQKDKKPYTLRDVIMGKI